MIGVDALSRTILLCRDYVTDEVSDEEIAHAFQTLRVLCIADAANLYGHTAQTALVTLVSLLSRMGMQVVLAIPDLPMLRPQPPIAGKGILSALVSASERFMPGATIGSAGVGYQGDVVFAIGTSEIPQTDASVWRLGATDWSGAIHPAGLTRLPFCMTEWPIGGMVSALLAANEAFKYVMRTFPLRQKSHEIFFEMTPECTWDYGAVALPEDSIDLEQIDFISAGAISQAVLYALSRLPGVQMQARIFDDDPTALSNLNRNMLSLLENVGVHKVHVIASRCAPQFKIEPVLRRYESGSRDIRLAQRVIVGVDDIPSRWVVQREAPGWVGVGGTSHFSISSSSHSIGEACSGCLHPVDDPEQRNLIPTIAFVSFWAGLSVTTRLIREALKTPYPSHRQHLWLTPLRLDQSHAAIWSPVPSLAKCPVGCAASRCRTSKIL